MPLPFGLKESLPEYSGKIVVDCQNVVKVYYRPEPGKGGLKNFFFPKRVKFNAVDGLSFNIRKNEIFGLLGPNGAGKTTLIKMIAGLLTPTSGNITVNGLPIEESLDKIGIMFSTTMIYHRLTGYDNLKYSAKLYRVKNWQQRINELADLLELGPWLNSYVENYSLGMKCKLAIARALINDPEVLLLDEPTLGLDPRISLQIRDYVKSMSKTILLTTHYMNEAAELCDRIAIINHGKVVRIGTPAALKKLIAENIIVNINLSYFSSELINKLQNLQFVHNVSLSKEGIKLLIDSKDYMPQLLALVSGYKVKGISEEEPTLVDVFIRLTGEKVV